MKIAEKSNFWQSDKPLMVLAPMANVTDAAFRRIIAKYGKADVMYTQFVSCNGLQSHGRKKLLPDLWYDESERPIVAQIFGQRPENFYKTAKLIKKFGFDGIDINMGCPDKNLVKSGSCVALINTPELAKKIIRETRRGAPDLPLSVKTRIGFNDISYKEWLPHILEEGVDALIVHLRTRKEMSKVDAHWELASDIAKLTHTYNTPIILNGDVQDPEDAHKKAKKYNLDGIMMGRAIFGNPWRFSSKIKKEDLSLEEVLRVMLEHAKLFDEIYGEIKPFHIMRKHFASYVSGFPEAKKLRVKLMETKNYLDTERVVMDYLDKK